MIAVARRHASGGPDRGRADRGRPDPGRGQATVEIALVLPVVIVLLLVVVQAGLVVRDRVLVVQAARAAARRVVVSPDLGAARAEAARVLARPFSISVTGARVPGGLTTVTVRSSPTPVPIVGYAVSGMRLEERFVVRVEGS